MSGLFAHRHLHRTPTRIPADDALGSDEKDGWMASSFVSSVVRSPGPLSRSPHLNFLHKRASPLGRYCVLNLRVRARSLGFLKILEFKMEMGVNDSPSILLFCIFLHAVDVQNLSLYTWAPLLRPAPRRHAYVCCLMHGCFGNGESHYLFEPCVPGCLAVPLGNVLFAVSSAASSALRNATVPVLSRSRCYVSALRCTSKLGREAFVSRCCTPDEAS